MKTINQKTGQTLVEFGLVFALVIVGLIFALATLKPELVKSYFRSSVTPGGHVESNGQLIVPEMSD